MAKKTNILHFWVTAITTWFLTGLASNLNHRAWAWNLRESFGRDEQAGLRLSPSCLEAELSKRELLLLTKANSRATVHRSAYLDFIAVRRFNKKGGNCR